MNKQVEVVILTRADFGSLKLDIFKKAQTCQWILFGLEL